MHELETRARGMGPDQWHSEPRCYACTSLSDSGDPKLRHRQTEHHGSVQGRIPLSWVEIPTMLGPMKWQTMLVGRLPVNLMLRQSAQ